MIRILLVDGSAEARRSLRDRLEAQPDLTVVGEAASAAEAVALAKTTHPQVILMDPRLPDTDGVRATERILAESEHGTIVVLTSRETDADVLRAVAAGAAGYLLKDASRAELAGAVRAAARGEAVPAPTSAAGGARQPREPAGPSLSPREVEVLTLVARSMTNAEIGQALHISEATVKTHLLRTFSKLDVSYRAAAVTRARALGLLG